MMEMKALDVLGQPVPEISRNVRWLMDNHFAYVDYDDDRNLQDGHGFRRMMRYGDDTFFVWAYVSHDDGRCTAFAGYYKGKDIEPAGDRLDNDECVSIYGYDDEPTFVSTDAEEAVKQAVSHGIETIDRFLEALGNGRR